MLATWDPNDLPAPDATDPDEARELGGIPEPPYPAPFNNSWDKREDYHPEDLLDQDWIGEDAEGVWICIHPITALSVRPWLWAICSEFWCGLKEIEREDYTEKSAFEHAGKLVMVCAHNREQTRKMKRPPDKGEDETDGD